MLEEAREISNSECLLKNHFQSMKVDIYWYIRLASWCYIASRSMQVWKLCVANVLADRCLLFLHLDSHCTILTYSPDDATWLPRLHSHHGWLTSLLKTSTSSLAFRFHFSFSLYKFHFPLVHALYFSLQYFFFFLQMLQI